MPEQNLRIVSWNVQEKRTDEDTLAPWLLARHVDVPTILCLQEVSAALLSKLQERADEFKFDLESSLDKRRLQKDGSTRDCYLVTLTNQSFMGTSQTWVTSDSSKRPLIARLFIPILRAAGKWDDTTIRNGALLTEVSVGHLLFRVINVHLSLTDPRTRESEFRTCRRRLRDDNSAQVICGDLNILQGLNRMVANLLIGRSIWYAFFKSERKQFDRILARSKLKNPLKGKRTHKGGQLDHILVDCLEPFVNQAYVDPDNHGSDHHPVVVDLKWVS